MDQCNTSLFGILIKFRCCQFMERDLSFSNILTEGGFLISAKVENRKRTEVKVVCQADGLVNLAHGLGDNYQINNETAIGEILSRNYKKGEELIIIPVNQ